MKKFLILILAILCLAGCAKKAPLQPTEGYTAPTLPEFDETQGPQQHLQAIFDGLRGTAFTASWGKGWEDTLSMAPCDPDMLKQVIPNENLVSDFCQQSMMVVPSNDGTFSYQRTELTMEEACGLICGRSLTEEEQSAISGYSDAIADLTITTDADEIFNSLQLTVTLDQTKWNLQIHIDLE